MLLDLQMPVVDGFEVLTTIKGRNEFPCLPIVVLSSMDEPIYIQQALNLGAADYLIKPVTTEERIEMARGLHTRWFKDEERPDVGSRMFNPWLVPRQRSDETGTKNQK